MQIVQYNFFLNLGPTHWLNNLKGFQVHWNLPTGGGKYGFIFGSFLPFPTLLISAFHIGNISKEHKILPDFWLFW